MSFDGSFAPPFREARLERDKGLSSVLIVSGAFAALGFVSLFSARINLLGEVSYGATGI